MLYIMDIDRREGEDVRSQLVSMHFESEGEATYLHVKLKPSYPRDAPLDAVE